VVFGTAIMVIMKNLGTVKKKDVIICVIGGTMIVQNVAKNVEILKKGIKYVEEN